MEGPLHSFGAGHLDYLQRDGLEFAALRDVMSYTRAVPTQRRLWHVGGVGRLDRAPAAIASGHPVRSPGEDLLTGLYGHGMPLAFLVRGCPGGVAISLGAWAAAEANDPSLARTDAGVGQEVTSAVLTGVYPAIDLAESFVPDDEGSLRLPLCGLVLGFPTAKPPDPADGSLPLDRLIRGLAGMEWSCLVLAEPIAEAAIAKIRGGVIRELRWVQDEVQRSMAASPLGQHYTELLQILLKRLTAGCAAGAWRTAVYLSGDAESYPRLASVWRSTFSGDESLPEPVRVWDGCDHFDPASWAAAWAMPDDAGPVGPVHYRHPFRWQTLLTSSQLASYIHLPQLETSGFSVRVVPDFDAVPPALGSAEASPAPSSGSLVRLGPVLHRGRMTGTSYDVELATLTRHTFVAGMTGAGKTNTVFHLLRQAAAADVPFLVIEPAKTEYRALLDDDVLGERLRVFTLGDEHTSKFRLNPFEALDGTPVNVHLDLLRSVFSASFGMWTPLPQVLEQCLHRVYVARGWDLTADENRRLGGADRAAAFPTLSELAAEVDGVVRALGYEERITADLRAALRTRLDGLRTGAKGRMLDVQRSVPAHELLQHPTILELEGMGDDDDKAFVMGLLLIQLAEYRRASGQSRRLQHILVVEEAHRLLANVGRGSAEAEADARGKAVETFTNLLAELRAYGQGIIIADQVPVKLAPDVIKNTGLKIAHRVVSADDRAVLAGAMAMDTRQARALATLSPGEAAVFGERDDAALLVKVPRSKDAPGQTVPDHARVAGHMELWRSRYGDPLVFGRYPPNDLASTATEQAWQAARDAVEDVAVRRAFARAALSMMADPGALDRLWPDLVAVVQAHRPPNVSEGDFFRSLCVHGSHWLGKRRGAQAAWLYAEVDDFAQLLSAALLAKLDGNGPEPTRTAFRNYSSELYTQRRTPCAGCELIHRPGPPVCHYRHDVADLVSAGAYSNPWHAAVLQDTASGGARRQQTWQVSQDAGQEIVEFPEPEWPEATRQHVDYAARRACLCFAQQMLTHNVRMLPRTASRFLARLVEESQR